MKVHEYLNLKTRVGVHTIALTNVIFLTFYTRIVCPFLDKVPFEELLTNILILYVVQVFLRELMYLFIPQFQSTTQIRQLYLISIFNWLLMGVIGAIYNQFYYDFPFGSQMKFLSGYWILGAGVCSQIEYLLFEKNYKSHTFSFSEVTDFLDHIPRRITESTFIFTLAPTLAMILLVLRYAFDEKLIEVIVVGEVAYISIFFLAICLLTSYFYGKNLKKDTEVITQAITSIKEGIFDIDLRPNRTDELGVVSRGINEMAAGLREREKIKEAFGRFVNPKIAQEFISKYVRGDKNLRQGEKKRLAILMSDIRNFTPLSEVTPPEEIIKMLNGYFNEMVQVIEKNGGIVDKFIGDAIMAVFGLLDQSLENPSLAAVKAGLEMEKSLEKYNQNNNQNIQIGIGVHVGEVVAGYLGSENRLEYTVIGSPVNLASRIEGETKDPAIPNLVFTQEVAKDIDKNLSSVALKSCRLKGIEKEVILYGFNEATGQVKV